MADVLGLSDVSSEDTGKGKQLKTGNLKRSYNMPKACVTKKMKPKSEGGQGMSAAKAVAACYPKATKAAKSAMLAVMPGTGIGSRVAKHLVKKATKKEIAMSKPKKLSIRRGESSAMEKRRRRSKAKSMSVAPKQQSTSKKKSKKKSKRRKGGKLGRDY